MNTELGFYSDILATCDLALLQVVYTLNQQTYRARVERIHSTGKGMRLVFLGSEIEVVGGGPTWGNSPLAVGDRALVFITAIHDRLYECTGRTHMLVETIEGVPYAIFEAKELWSTEQVPVQLRKHFMQDPSRSYASAIRFDLMEKYLVGLIEKIDPRRLR